MTDIIKNRVRNIPEKPQRLTNIQRLMDIVNNRIDNRILKPEGFPVGQQEIAKYWIDFLEPRLKHEVADDRTDPYQERLANCLSAFYKLNHRDQRYINKLRAEGVFWRGDSMEFMRLREKLKMAKIDKTRLFSMMKTIIRRG